MMMSCVMISWRFGIRGIQVRHYWFGACRGIRGTGRLRKRLRENGVGCFMARLSCWLRVILGGWLEESGLCLGRNFFNDNEGQLTVTAATGKIVVYVTTVHRIDVVCFTQTTPMKLAPISSGPVVSLQSTHYSDNPRGPDPYIH